MEIQEWLNKPNALRKLSVEEFENLLPSLAYQLSNISYLYSYSENELRQDWNKLLSYKFSSFITAAQVRPGMKLCEHFFPNFFDIYSASGKNFKQFWNEHDLQKVIKWNRSSHSTPYLSEMRRGISFCFGLTKNTMYRPHLAKIICEHYQAKKVFDPCCGWGGRMLGAVAAGARYIGCEPNKETYENLMRLAEFLKIEDKIEIYNIGAENFDYSDCYDLVLTSPPYYNLEVYSNDITQSENQYPSYHEWKDNWFLSLVEKSCQIANTICWNLADVGKITLQKDFYDYMSNKTNWTENQLFGIGSSARQANQNELKNKKNLDKTITFTKL